MYDFMTVDDDRSAHRRDQFLGQRADVFDLRDLGKDYGEFITA